MKTSRLQHFLALVFLCFFYEILPAQQLSNDPFLKILGTNTKDESALGVYDAKDGNLYVTGITGGDSLSIMKMTPQGDFIWSKAINLKTNLQGSNSREVVSDLLVDNEGKIVVLSTLGNDIRGLLFRYDPVTDTMLWIQELVLTAHAMGLVQDPVDGHFMVYTNSRDIYSTTDPGTEAKFTKINKETGVFILIPASAIRFQTDTTTKSLDLIRSVVVHEGKFYGCGGFTFKDLGSAGRRHNLTRFALNGDVEWSRMGPADAAVAQNLAGHDLFIENQHIISTFSGNDAGSDSTLSAVFLQKSTLEGDVVWVKKFELGASYPFLLAKEVISVSDGFVLLCHLGNGQPGLFFIKTNKDGELVWAKKLDAGGSFLDDGGIPQSQLLQFNGSIYFAAANRDSSGHSDMMIGKMTPDGALGIDCDLINNIPATELALINPQSVAVNMQKLLTGESVIKLVKVFNDVSIGVQTVCTGGGPEECDTIRLEQTQTFCPGSTVNINGQMFTQPGIVMDTLTGIQGCDTIITYTLIHSTPAPSQITLNCPANVSVIAEPGTTPFAVSYNQPSVTTDCPCPGVSVSLTSGLASGALFPDGITNVCYTAKDSCGQSASCCFFVNIRELQACDEKISGCVTYEILDINADAAQNLTYRIRVTNNCSNKLIYTAIQLPDASTAITPSNNALYTAPSGRDYEVRNPNFSPMYSIRFKSTTDSIANGQSEEFQYKLPAQTAPTYINITSRLAPQLFYEAHLNTFNCPIGINLQGNKAQERSYPNLISAKKPLLFPNPTDGALQADLSAWAGERIQLKVYNSLGKALWQTQLEADVYPSVIQLPETFIDGMYFFEITSASGDKQAVRAVLKR